MQNNQNKKVNIIEHGSEVQVQSGQEVKYFWIVSCQLYQQANCIHKNVNAYGKAKKENVQQTRSIQAK